MDHPFPLTALEVDRDRAHAGSSLKGACASCKPRSVVGNSLRLEFIGEERTEIHKVDGDGTDVRVSTDQHVFLQEIVELYYTEHDKEVAFCIQVPAGAPHSLIKLTPPQQRWASRDSMSFTNTSGCAFQYRLQVHRAGLQGFKAWNQLELLCFQKRSETINSIRH